MRIIIVEDVIDNLNGLQSNIASSRSRCDEDEGMEWDMFDDAMILLRNFPHENIEVEE